jgi:hypothetical protein
MGTSIVLPSDGRSVAGDTFQPRANGARSSARRGRSYGCGHRDPDQRAGSKKVGHCDPGRYGRCRSSDLRHAQRATLRITLRPLPARPVYAFWRSARRQRRLARTRPLPGRATARRRVPHSERERNVNCLATGQSLSHAHARPPGAAHHCGPDQRPDYAGYGYVPGIHLRLRASPGHGLVPMVGGKGLV